MSSMRLPTALQAWHPWLSWFAPELAAQLGEVLQRMHPLMGRYNGRRQGGAPEPDGVEDLRRRGSYERLLSSEWLLATELPDEFLRRAAGGEHLFLAPRPRATQADRLIVAVFDTGPWQLGAPRLAQLALWILLARRALEAGGELRWGVLHQPGQWHAATAPEHLQQMLRLRTYSVADEGAWPAWAQWLAEHADGLGESWWVGHSVVGAGGRGAQSPSHTVQVRQALDGASLAIELRAGPAARSLQLPLPDPVPHAQLLRGHFLNEAPPAAHVHRQHAERLSLKHAPVINAYGTLVAVPLLTGDGVMVFRVHNPAERKRSKPKRLQWSKSAEPLCAAFAGNSLGAVLNQHQGLHFWQIKGLAATGRPPREDFHAPPGRASLLPGVWQVSAGRSRLYVLDASQRLVFWVDANASNRARGPMLLHEDVHALAPVNDNRLVYVSRDEQRLCVHFADAGGREKREYRLPHVVGDDPVLLAGGATWNVRFGGCALRTSDASTPEEWSVHETPAQPNRDYDSWQAQLAPGARAVGLVHLSQLKRYSLVVQAANRSDFFLQSRDGSEPLYSAPAAVERATVCPVSGLVALLTRQRELHVYSPAGQSLRLVIHSDDSTEAHDETA
jgi:hypothetical protein